MTDRDHRGSGGDVPWRPLPGRTAPTHVRQSLDHLAQTLGLGGMDALEQLFMDWPSIVGPDLARHCRPTSLHDGVLAVRATSSEWAVELSWMTELVAERCNEALGDGSVIGVRIIR